MLTLPSIPFFRWILITMEFRSDPWVSDPVFGQPLAGGTLSGFFLRCGALDAGLRQDYSAAYPAIPWLAARHPLTRKRPIPLSSRQTGLSLSLPARDGWRDSGGLAQGLAPGLDHRENPGGSDECLPAAAPQQSKTVNRHSRR